MTRSAAASSPAARFTGMPVGDYKGVLSNVYYALSQSSIGGNTKGGLEKFGIKSDEHIPVTFTLSRNAETGSETIRYSEPKGLPVKFSWTTTIDVDGNAVTTPIRIEADSRP